jgi:hypothetical protein
MNVERLKSLRSNYEWTDGVICTTAKTHIQLKKLEMDEPLARIRVVLICYHLYSLLVKTMISLGRTSAGYSQGYVVI